jgi:UPF0042 nucleotide-binding protein
MMDSTEVTGDEPGKRRLIIVTGLSGSGKSVALRTLEDLGYFCIDNLPLDLVDDFLEQSMSKTGNASEHCALGMDLRSGLERPERLLDSLARVRKTIEDTRVIYLHADDATLIKRYSETRRRHPLANDARSLAEAIDLERELMKPVAEQAELPLDTSATSVHQLRRSICNSLGAADQDLALLFESFAYKRGVPPDVDFAFDVRCLPNPHWEKELRPLTGLEPPVQEFLESHQSVRDMVADICNWLQRWIPEFESEHRSYLTVGIGCTGGKHRSVYIAERLALHFQQQREHVLTYHRELI